MLDAYASGSEAFKEITRRYGLTPDMIDNVMTDVNEVSVISVKIYTILHVLCQLASVIITDHCFFFNFQCPFQDVAAQILLRNRCTSSAILPTAVTVPSTSVMSSHVMACLCFFSLPFFASVSSFPIHLASKQCQNI